ncbi:MAG: glycogen/starch/alpha-glucan phosphorylase [Tissierellales bacterium]|jgi:starch phosphorylase|nr:glycogen/starch/alpha-glucan phosphorylase [Tissierellales bacterium]
MINKEEFKEDYIRRLKAKSAKPMDETSVWDRFHALGSLTKEYLAENWLDSSKYYFNNDLKQVYYFSMEFLTGKFLKNNLVAMQMEDMTKEVMDELGFDLEEIYEIEKDQGLGNGGLGRLAACFLDSMAALSIPGHGIGIRYKYGLFEQKIVNGYQVEYPDRWLENRNVWEVRKADKAVEVKFGGDIEEVWKDGRMVFDHKNYESILAVPYDMPIVGHKNKTVNTLRLWSAETHTNEFDFSTFSRGDYMKAFEQKHSVEAISQVLYPNDTYEEGKILRLKQEYFFVSAGVQGILRTYKKKGKSIKHIAEYVAIHINDTHPSLAIPEFMRILVDEEHLDWDEAWHITTQVMSYTNHTIMHEAMECWPEQTFKELLPRIYMIIKEINERFCSELWKGKFEGDLEAIERMAIIAHNQIRMAYLAIVGSHSVNGVAHLHTEILKYKELNDFYKVYPYKFNNKTNGITHRRWLLNSNEELSKVITDKIGSDWERNPTMLRRLLSYKNDLEFQNKIDEAKFRNKKRLAEFIKIENGVDVDPNSIFDIHVKRLHEYKRQTLNVLHIMHLYNELLENPDLDIPPRTFIFGAKAAPGYHIAKQIIKWITTLADKVNNDKRIKNKIKVVFLENYGVSLAEMLIPAADVSEQISTTTKEASGTGNMKFMMNGAITIATLDGANVEILNEVGQENIVTFGLTEPEVYNLYEVQTYDSRKLYEEDERIKLVLDQLVDGFFDVSSEEFQIIRDSFLKHNDEFFVLKDFDSYVKAQTKIGELYRDKQEWTRMAITNIACSGKFSSDRTILEYASGIWDVEMRPR